MNIIRNILLLIVLVTLPGTTIAKDGTEDDPNDFENIKHILIYSMPWSVLTNSAVEPEVLISWPKRLYTNVEVHDKSVRRQLDSLLTELVPSPQKLYDVRTVCLLFRKDRVDTLSFWSGTTCRLNGHNYNVQTRSGINLVDVILKFLPHQDAQDILFIREIMNDSSQTRNSQQIPDGKDSTEKAK